MEERYRRLADYCHEQAGDSLQSLFTYTEDSAEPYHVREDRKEAFRSGGFEQFQKAAWEVHTTVLEEAPKVDVLGDYRATVHTFETAFAIQFRISDDEGVVVTFDRDIGRNLHEFLLECEHFI
ncbi:MAG: hypothetical protein ABEJ06_04715 [Haloarculaceae archaeon]